MRIITVHFFFNERTTFLKINLGILTHRCAILAAITSVLLAEAMLESICGALTGLCFRLFWKQLLFPWTPFTHFQFVFFFFFVDGFFFYFLFLFVCFLGGGVQIFFLLVGVFIFG